MAEDTATQIDAKFHFRGGSIQDHIEAAQKTNIKKEEILAAFKTYEVPIPETLQKTISSLKVWYEEKFKEYGIDTIQWPEHILRVAKGSPLPSGLHGGYNSLGIIVVPELDINDPELAMFEEARFFAHELYHSTGKTRFRIRKDNMDTRFELAGMGADFKKNSQKSAKPALEEGLATIYETEAQSFIRQLMPEGAIKHDKLIKPDKDQLLRRNSVLTEDNLHISLCKGNFLLRQIVTGTPGFANSLTLIHFLEKNIPDFRKLVERARVLNEVIPFARALRERFGEKMFYHIGSATEVTAAHVKKSLEIGLSIQKAETKLAQKN